MDIKQSVGAGFARVAARLPAKTAIESEGRQVSYAELDSAANAVARRLLVGDARLPARVALLFNDRIASITAMLGVLKAGDAYVPLDADDPDERVQFVLRDCAPVALITDGTLLERARTLVPEGCRLINIDETESDGVLAPLPEVAPDALAYLFYTSGSTGQPKGVCHSHRNMLYSIGRYLEAIEIREDDRLSLLYSLSVSAGNMDIYKGLLNGASVHAYDVRRNGISPLAEWLVRAGITILHTVPTVFRHLVGSLDRSHRFDGIRAVDLGGEMVFASDVTLFRRHFREDCRLANRLSATEAMLMAQYVVHPTEPYEGVQILPVGRSPNGIKLQIQRPDGSEANAGEVGEIVVSSPSVSLGYWQRPDLNAAAFSDDAENPGWRIYRTGDLGRIAADGNLHFLGRNGTRVKIRGQSVDLAEVEAGLRQCISVRDAAVITESRGGDQQEADRLVAYVVTGLEADRDPRKIRRELAKQVPFYMLPSAYVFLDALPLTATGKVNRKGLPQSGDLSVRQSQDYQLLRNESGTRAQDDKIGGNRIDLAGIESALLQIPLVRYAAVVASEQARNDACRLIVFVVVSASWLLPKPTPNSINAHLQSVLPVNHQPTVIVELDAMPLLPGGKVDRNALEVRAKNLDVTSVSSKNPIEVTLVELVQQALGVSHVGVHDDFFLHHGCDSLGATEILLRVSRFFKRELPLSALYEASTVATLGQCLLDDGWRPPASGVLSLHREGTRLPLFAIAGIKGHALRLLLVGHELGEELPFYALQPPDMDWDQAACVTIEDMAACYVSEIRLIQPHGPYHLLGASFGGIMVFEIALQLQSAGEEVALLAMLDTNPPDCFGQGWSDRAVRRPLPVLDGLKGS